MDSRADSLLDSTCSILLFYMTLLSLQTYYIVCDCPAGLEQRGIALVDESPAAPPSTALVHRYSTRAAGSLEAGDGAEPTLLSLAEIRARVAAQEEEGALVCCSGCGGWAHLTCQPSSFRLDIVMFPSTSFKCILCRSLPSSNPALSPARSPTLSAELAFPGPDRAGMEGWHAWIQGRRNCQLLNGSSGDFGSKEDDLDLEEDHVSALRKQIRLSGEFCARLSRNRRKGVKEDFICIALHCPICTSPNDLGTELRFIPNGDFTSRFHRAFGTPSYDKPPTLHQCDLCGCHFHPHCLPAHLFDAFLLDRASLRCTACEPPPLHLLTDPSELSELPTARSFDEAWSNWRARPHRHTFR